MQSFNFQWFAVTDTKNCQLRTLNKMSKVFSMYNTRCYYKISIIINDFKNIIANTCLNIIIFKKNVKTRNLFVILYTL